MGVNIGTYGYQGGAGNLLQQLNVPEEAKDAEEEQEEDEEYESQEEEDPDDDDDAEEHDDIVEDEENELECYLRNVSIENGRLRARTAPLRPMEQIE